MRTTEGGRRGTPLSRYLAALVLLPLVGVVVLSTAEVRSRAAEAASVERAEGAVRTLALLDAARSATEQEMTPVLTLGVLGGLDQARARAFPPGLEDVSQSSLRDAWTRVRTSPAVTAMDDVLANGGQDVVQSLSTGQVLAFLAASHERTDVLGALVEQAVDDTERLVAADHAAPSTDCTWCSDSA